jgi:hypothetical protein
MAQARRLGRSCRLPSDAYQLVTATVPQRFEVVAGPKDISPEASNRVSSFQHRTILGRDTQDETVLAEPRVMASGQEKLLAVILLRLAQVH